MSRLETDPTGAVPLGLGRAGSSGPSIIRLGSVRRLMHRIPIAGGALH